MDLYAENILDHYRNPRNRGKGKVLRGKGEMVSHREENISCGDEVTVFIEITDGKIFSIVWDGIGCAISQAGISMLCEEVEGMATGDVLALGQQDIYKLLGVPIGPRRFKCALLCLHTVKNALRKAEGLEPQSWLETVEIATTA